MTHTYVFMTVNTLADLRVAGLASDIDKVQPGTVQYSYYQNHRVITVPRGMLQRGEVIMRPTDEITAWVFKHYRGQRWPLPECIRDAVLPA